MDNYNDIQNNKSEENLKDSQTVEKAVEVSQENNHIFSSELGKTSLPIEQEAEIQEQIEYAEKKLEKYYKEKAQQKALKLKQSAYLPVKKIEGQIDLSVLENILNKSALGQAFLKGNGQAVPKLVIDEQIFGVSLYKKAKIIGIHHQMTYGEALYLTVKALRRAWLSMEGNLLHPLSYLPDDAVLINRILEADCRTLAIWVAWELKLQSENDMWDHIIQSDDVLCAHSFAEQAKKDFRSLDNGEAARVCFNAWFDSYSVKTVDYEIIQNMLSDEKGYVFSSDEVPVSVTSHLVESIGQVPGNRNYMVGFENKPLPDTKYAVVTDRSNANFLWFVKFEKSFQETELQMLEEEREEKERQTNIEKSMSSEIDIKEIAKMDEKIVDFSHHFKRRLESDHISQFNNENHKNQVLGKDQKNETKVTHLFDSE